MTVERSAMIPELASRSVEMRPLLSSDNEWCYALMCGPAGSRWRYRGRTPAPEVVAGELWNGVFAQYVVQSRATGERVGLVGLYNVSIESSRAHGFAVAQPSDSALVVQAFGLLCDWAFDQFSLQRIFIETAEFNVEAFASLGDVAIVEGRLRNYELWKGRYWDCFIMSISVQAFRDRYGALLDTVRSDFEPASSSEEEFVQTCTAVWPLDSLGAVEVLCALEDLFEIPIEPSILEDLPVDSSEQAAAVLIERARELRASWGSPAID